MPKPSRRRRLTPRNFMAIPRWITDNCLLRVDWILYAEALGTQRMFDWSTMETFEEMIKDVAELDTSIFNNSVLVALFEDGDKKVNMSACTYLNGEWVGLSKKAAAGLAIGKRAFQRVITHTWVKMHPSSPVVRTVQDKYLPAFKETTEELYVHSKPFIDCRQPKPKKARTSRKKAK